MCMCVCKMYQSYGKILWVKLGIWVPQQLEDLGEIFFVIPYFGLGFFCFFFIWIVYRQEALYSRLKTRLFWVHVTDARLANSLERRAVISKGTEFSLIWLETLCWLGPGQGKFLMWTWSKSQINVNSLGHEPVKVTSPHPTFRNSCCEWASEVRMPVFCNKL